MLYDSKNRTFEAVLVYKLDRFAGSSYDSSVNRVVLFDDECYIYFNISDDKGTQLKLSEHQILNKKLNFGKKTTRTQVFGLLSLGGTKVPNCVISRYNQSFVQIIQDYQSILY